MPSKLSFATRAAWLACVLCVGCSESDDTPHSAGSGGTPALDDTRFVPENLPNTEQNDDQGGLTLIAFTLVEGASAPVLYAAVRNDGETPACQAGMETYFFDKAEQPITSVASSLLSGRHYQFDDGSGTAIVCVAPGQVAMSATELPATIVIEQLGHLEHGFPAFTVDGITPLAGLEVSLVTAKTTGAERTYTGTLTNRFEQAVSNPTVTIFPLNAVGRPLGVTRASGGATTEIPAGGSWMFETPAVTALSTAYAAYPAAKLP